MLLKNKLFDLQLFADGGDGGSAGGDAGVDSGVPGTSGEDLSAQIPRSIPERAKKRWLDAVEKTRSVSQQAEANHPQETPAEDPTATPKEDTAKKPTFAELMKSEEYKEERDAYMHDAFKRRMKDYDSVKKDNETAMELLYGMAERLGVDQSSKSFFDDMKASLSKKDTDERVAKYLETHDVDEAEAARIVEMEDKLTAQKRQEFLRKAAEEAAERKAKQEQALNALRASAEQTKVLYPSFNLEAEMQNDTFRRVCAACGGNTTAAYRAVHHDKLAQGIAAAAAEEATNKATNAVAANSRRPSENGLQDTASSVAEINFSGMNAKQLREYYQKNRDALRRR